MSVVCPPLYGNSFRYPSVGVFSQGVTGLVTGKRGSSEFRLFIHFGVEHITSKGQYHYLPVA